jgi:adenylate cyclase
VEAALRILEAEDRRNEERRRLGLAPVSCRIAINSGLVVVGDVGSDQRVDYTVLGNTVNVAARLEQSVAQVGQIVIGPETRRQLGPGIGAESLGTFQLKGMQQKLEAFRVVR